MSAFSPLLVPVVAGLLAVAAASATAAEMPATPEGGAPPVDGGAGLRAGDWLVRGRLSGSIPTERRSRIDLIGGRIETPSALLPDLDVSYFLTDHIAVEAQAGAVRSRPKIRDSLVGDIAIGTIWNAAAMGVVQIHLLPHARINPYLGVGVAATTPLAITPARGIPAFTLKSQVSPVLQAGVDVHLGGNWFGNAMVKYVFIPRNSYALAGVTVEAEMNMLILGAGLGYRF